MSRLARAWAEAVTRLSLFIESALTDLLGRRP